MIVNVDNLAKLVADRMVGYMDANKKDYLENDDFEFLYEQSFDALIKELPPTTPYNKVYQKTLEHPEIELAFTVIKEMQSEARQDFIQAEERYQNPMKYYGLKQSDFV